jgi:uncharacterized protein (TIGR04222 family)
VGWPLVGLPLILAFALVLVLAAPVEAGSQRTEGVECDATQPDDEASVSPSPSGESIERYTIDVLVDKAGNATFKEEITFSFSGAKHGIFRDIIVHQKCTDEYDREYPFDVVSVSSSTGAPAQYTIERPTPTASNPLDLINFLVDTTPIRRIKIGDPDRTITGTHTYEIVYTLDGVVNGFSEHDELYWNVIGNGWAVPINDVDVTVRTPAPASSATCFAGPTGARTPCTSAEVTSDGVSHYTQDSLNARENLTVLTVFPTGSIENTAPILDERWSVQRAFEPSTALLVLTVVLLVVVAGGFLVITYRVGRDHQLAGSHVDVAFAPVGSQGTPVPFFADDHAPVEFAPPDGILPAQAGLLDDEVVHPVEITATLVHLAVRGYLRIEEIERRWRKDDYLLIRLEKDTSGLVEYERTLLERLVSVGQQRKLSDLKDTFAPSFNSVVNKVYADGVQRGWFHGRPDKVRGRWRGLGIGLLVVSIVLAVPAILYTRVAVLTIPVFVAGLLFTFGARVMPRRTPAGTGLLRRLRGFEEFIRDSEAPRAQWAENRNIFSEYLPYAIVFRCADKWAKTFEDLGEGALADQDWYRGDSLSAIYIASSMSSFSSSASSTLTSTPASTGSGSGGGGSSGGGGGGGGGGSW